MNGTAAAAALLGIALLPLATADSAAAQAWPTKSVKLIVTLSPGSAADTVARVVGDQVGQQLGQSFVIENRPGGGGTIGANAVAKADPDGYTLLVNTNLHTIAPAVMAHVPYDVEKDFAGITPIGYSPHVMIVPPSLNTRTLMEFVALGKARPGGINYASVAGSATHLNGAHFLQTMKVEGRMVPFKGAPEAITEVLTGRVDVYFSPILAALPHIKDGKLVGLGITATKRSQVFPDMPTTIEAGYPNSEFGLLFCLFAPAKTPRDIVDKLYAETAKALRNPAVDTRLKALGIEQNIMQPAAFDTYIRAQLKIDADLVQKAGLGKQ